VDKEKELLVEELTADKLIDMNDQKRKELFDNFATYYSSNIKSTINGINKGGSLYNPHLSNGIVKQIGGRSKAPIQADLEKWVSEPKKYAKNLREVSSFFDKSIMQYKRTTDHFKKILTYRYDLRLGTPFKKEDLETVMNSRNRSLEFLMDFDVKYQTALVTDRVMENGGGFYYLQKNGDFNTLIELPIDYCYITGRWDRGLTFALDLSWFDEMESMKEQMPEIYAYYETFIKMRKVSNNSNVLKNMQYYPIPIEKGVVFTFGLNDTDLIPPFSGVFRDANRILTYKNLLMQKTSLDTWKIIGQKIPLHKETQAPLFSPEQAQIFVDFVQSVLPEGTAVFATPMDFDTVDISGATNQDNIIGRGEELFWRSVGVNGTMMDSGDKSAGTLKYSLENDFGFVEQMYNQFENFINLQLRLISRKYRFFVKFYGNRHSEKEDIKDYKDLVATLNVPIGKLYGLMGYEPFEIIPTIDLENALGIKEKGIPIIGGSQQSSDDKGGAPKKDDGSLTSSGESNRNNESNFKGGKSDEI